MSKYTTRAHRLTERLHTLIQNEDGMTTFVFRGFPSSGGGFGAGSTASTKNTADQLRAKGYIAGTDYMWVSPMKLRIQLDKVDRDLLDVIQSEGGFQSEEPESEEEGEEQE